MITSSDLVMGTEDVIISSIDYSEDQTELVITGENFTPWSKIYVNDAQINTEYISGTELRAAAGDIPDGAAVTVCQVGSSNTIFRSSDQVTFWIREGSAGITRDGEGMPDTTESDVDVPQVQEIENPADNN